MVESESKKNGGGPEAEVFLSWADEVEQEEEAQDQSKQKQKPNPFGSARPREVVLQEKGIDWRKLDLQLQQQPSSLLRQKPLNEKSCKENITASTFSVTNRVRSEPLGKCLKQKQKDANPGFNLSTISNQMPLIFIPPLRYPPRNITSSLSRNLYVLENGNPGFQSRSNLKPDRKNVICWNGSQNLDSKRHIQPHCHEQQSQFKKNGSKYESGQSVGAGRKLQKPMNHTKYSDHDHARRKLENNEQNAMGSLLGKPPRQHKMMPPSPNVRDWKNVKDDHAASEGAKECFTFHSCVEKRWNHRNSY